MLYVLNLAIRLKSGYAIHGLGQRYGGKYSVLNSYCKRGEYYGKMSCAMESRGGQAEIISRFLKR